MAKVTITGKSGKTYNLDKLSEDNSRIDGSSPLTIQIWYWSPDASDIDHTLPDPPNPVLGQIWLSKLVSDPEQIEKLNNSGWKSENGGV